MFQSIFSILFVLFWHILLANQYSMFHFSMFYRCVAAKQKTLAIGVQWLVLRLLGSAQFCFKCSITFDMLNKYFIEKSMFICYRNDTWAAYFRIDHRQRMSSVAGSVQRDRKLLGVRENRHGSENVYLVVPHEVAECIVLFLCPVLLQTTRENRVGWLWGQANHQTLRFCGR